MAADPSPIWAVSSGIEVDGSSEGGICTSASLLAVLALATRLVQG
jgi:hypothetical protein